MEASDKIAWNPIPQKPVEAVERLERKKTTEGLAPTRDSRFQDLLENIERLRIEGRKLGGEREPDTGAETEDLDEAMDLADRTHENAMDMRRKLEEAFRRHVTG